MRRRILRPWGSMAVQDPVKRFRVWMEKETTRRAGHQLARARYWIGFRGHGISRDQQSFSDLGNKGFCQEELTNLDAEVANAATGLAESDLLAN
jgi:hypothetical protein